MYATRELVKSDTESALKLFMQAPAAIAVVKGKKHIFEFTNTLYLKLVGKQDDIIGRSVRQVFPELRGQGFFEILDEVYATGKPFVGNEMPLELDMTGSGKLVKHFVNFVYQPMKNESGEVEGIMAHAVDVTEGVVARQTIEKSEERFRMLIEQSTDAIQLVSREGKILYSSESLKNVLGYTPEEIQDSGVTPFLHPDDMDYFFKNLTELQKKPHGQIDMQYRVKHKDGSWAWLETTGVNRLDNPNINALVGTFRNITERKKSEEEILYQKSLLEAQQEVSPLGIIIVSDKGKIVSYNKRFSDMWQFPSEVMDADLDEVALKAAQQQLKDPKEFIQRVSYLYKARKGSYEQLDFIDGRIFDRHGSPIFGKDNRYYGYVWYFLDITEQKKAEKALKSSEQRLRFMAESMPQKVFTATPTGEVDYYNPQWMEYTGLTFEQIKDWGWTQFIHPDDVEENIRSWKHSLDTGEPFTFEHRFRNYDGEYHWHLSRAQPLRDGSGNIIRWFGSSTDIEEIKNTTERKNELELITEALKEQRTQLVALNQAKDEFISLASHQLRTPASATKQFLGMVLEGFSGELNEAQRQLLERARDTNERQITIINDLLEVALVDAGKISLQKTSTDLVKLIEDVLVDQTSKFSERGQTITFKPSSPSIKVRVDIDRFRMALENIIDNASKYTPHGKKVSISLVKAHGLVKIHVKDEGVGMSKTDLVKLFRKFSRLDNPLSVVVGGTGLGLYWAKKIIDLHGGDILVSSKEARGTTFTIELPL